MSERAEKLLFNQRLSVNSPLWNWWLDFNLSNNSKNFPGAIKILSSAVYVGEITPLAPFGPCMVGVTMETIVENQQVGDSTTIYKGATHDTRSFE